MAKKNPSLSVGRGEKLSVKAGAGLTAKGRAKLNRATGSNLQAPAPNPRTKADKGYPTKEAFVRSAKTAKRKTKR